jgi:orotate phosphoribosyltransferase
MRHVPSANAAGLVRSAASSLLIGGARETQHTTRLTSQLLRNDHVDAVSGPAMGAIPLVTLMARTHWIGFYVRLREQAHGRRPAIGGIPP